MSDGGSEGGRSRAGSSAQVHLEWRGSERRETVTVGWDEAILEAAADADIGLPFGCQTGACGTCTARLLAGSVEHRRPVRALKERHLEDGYVLTCIATPASDEVRLEVGAQVQADLVPNPWK